MEYRGVEKGVMEKGVMEKGQLAHARMYIRTRDMRCN
jgi:hypothetical protein